MTWKTAKSIENDEWLTPDQRIRILELKLEKIVAYLNTQGIERPQDGTISRDILGGRNHAK